MPAEVHGRTVILKGHETLGIPQGARVRVSQLPKNNIVKEIRSAEGGDIPFSLDPGKYVYCVRTHDPKGNTGMRYVEEFFVGCNEENYKKLASLVPQVARARQTTEGVRYHCGYIGCKTITTSAFAMVEHEASHQGISLLKEPERKTEATAKSAAVAKSQAETLAADKRKLNEASA